VNGVAPPVIVAVKLWYWLTSTTALLGAESTTVGGMVVDVVDVEVELEVDVEVDVEVVVDVEVDDDDNVVVDVVDDNMVVE